MASKLKSAWHHLLDSLAHYVMHFFWVAVMTAILGVAAFVRGNKLLFLALIIACGLFLSVILVTYLLHMRDLRRREHRLPWRRRRELRRYTDAGLGWRVPPESHTQLRDGRMAAVLSIAPVPGSELPQPLDIVVACGGNITEAISTFYLDPSQPEEVPVSGDVEIDAPSGSMVTLRLLSPKLLPPARWDLMLVSAGNAAIRVLSVRRAPRKSEAEV